MGNKGFVKFEPLLRFLACFLLAIAGILMRTDSQTRIYFDVVKKVATFRSCNIFLTSVYVYFAGAGYSLVHLIRCLFFTKYHEDQFTSTTHYLKWIYFLLDQVATYILFATNCAAIEFSMIAIFGADSLQWMKLCNKFTRFCFQAGTSIVFALLACIPFALISGISTFNLFRWYSPNFLCLKPKRVGVLDTI